MRLKNTSLKGIVIFVGFITFNLFTPFNLFMGQQYKIASANQKDTDVHKAVTLAIYGDSLSAGYGLPDGEGFADKLGDWLAARGHTVQILNASLSGDTTAGGLARLDWSLPSSSTPDALLLELGANDAMRGLPPEEIQRNLDILVSRLKARGIAILMAGMRAPRNWGDAYENDFNAIYKALAQKHSVALYPFFLEGVAAQPELNQNDGIHPNSNGVQYIVERIGPKVVELLKAASSQTVP